MKLEEKVELIRGKIDALLEREARILVAIDGKCTSGKTTLAARLEEIYDCNVFRVDDFFLRPEQRTEERYAQIGGNVDYERFREEVLDPLVAGREFSYRPFNCKCFALSEPVSVPVKKLNIIEGSYSMHPHFADPYDLKILLTVAEDTQRQRVLERPVFVREQFFTRWIPMENRYLEHFRIFEKADLVL